VLEIKREAQLATKKDCDVRIWERKQGSRGPSRPRGHATIGALTRVSVGRGRVGGHDGEYRWRLGRNVEEFSLVVRKEVWRGKRWECGSRREEGKKRRVQAAKCVRRSRRPDH